MNKAATSLLAIVLISVTLSANAIVISVEPKAQKVEVGDQVNIDLAISGLGAQAAPGCI